MTNNDILKKLRIALELKDTDIIEILKLSDFEISKTELNAFFRKPDHRNYKECGDQVLRRFLDGLIIKKRGPRNQKKLRVVKRDELYKGIRKKRPPN
ncbi:MAG: DUF1456 family protein [Deltaproteobacteria bacterium]|nr:DUF1456 family protein [Deltaproteobacteria bacterium]